MTAAEAAAHAAAAAAHAAALGVGRVRDLNLCPRCQSARWDEAPKV